MKIRNLFLIPVVIGLFCVNGWPANDEPNQAKPKEIKFYNLPKEYKELQTQSFQLKKAKVLELKPIVENMLSIYGSAYVNEKDNTIYITDTPEMIDNLMKVVPQLDADGIVAGGNLTSKVILLKHTDASDIIELIKHKLSKDGKVFKVANLNGIIITDISSKIAEVENLVKDLDVVIKHISIDITILEVNSEIYENIGLDFIGWLKSLDAHFNVWGGKSQSEYTYEWGRANDVYKNTYGGKYESLWGGVYGTLNIDKLVDILRKDGKGKVLASPKIITKNNKSAYLNASEMIPYTPSEESYWWKPGEAVARAGIDLSVLPIIQQDDFINLSISPRISDLTGWSPKGMPIIFERSLQTEVNVKDGSTFVLGGLKKTEKVKTVQGIPILKSIPIIKYFFSKTVDVDFTREIVMFITPRILKEEQYLPEEDKKQLEEMKKMK